MRSDRHPEHIRVRIAAREQASDRCLGVPQRRLWAGAEQSDVGACRVQDTEREVVSARHAVCHGERTIDLALGTPQVARLLQIAREVVARDRLLPRVAGVDREPQQLFEPLAPVRDTDVAEHQAGGPPGEDPQVPVTGVIGNADGEISFAQSVRVRPGEEAHLSLQRGNLAARRRVVRPSQVALRLDRELERPLQITAMQTDSTLESARSGAQTRVTKRPPRLVAANRRIQRPGRILVIAAPGSGDGAPRRVYPVAVRGVH